MREVRISSEPIELYKLLKLGGLASSGGEAKSGIADGLVSVNGEVETRKRKKIVSGDVVEFADEKLLIQLASREESAHAAPSADSIRNRN